jgi:RNA polymerase sigma-70 factor, ECF subfamily
MTGPTRSAETAPNEHAHAALSDEALMRRIATGDHLAMRTLYARHSTLVFRFAHRLLGDSTSAEDVRAEVFLAVWRQAGRFEARCSVSTWLLAITRNKALSSLRRTREVYLDAKAAALVPDPADDAEINVLKKDRDDILRRTVGRLPTKQAEVIDLVLPRQVDCRGRADPRHSGKHREDANAPCTQEARHMARGRAPHRRAGAGGLAALAGRASDAASAEESGEKYHRIAPLLPNGCGAILSM